MSLLCPKGSNLFKISKLWSWPQAERDDSCGNHLVSFLFSWITISCDIVQCLETVASCILHSFIPIYGRRVKPVPVSLSWLKFYLQFWRNAEWNLRSINTDIWVFMVIVRWLRKDSIITKFKKRKCESKYRPSKMYIMCLFSSLSSLGQSTSSHFLGYMWLSITVPAQPLPVTHVGMFIQAEPIKMLHAGTSPVVQGLRLHIPNARGLCSISDQGTRFHTLQPRLHMLQLKMPCATMKIEDLTCHD